MKNISLSMCKMPYTTWCRSCNMKHGIKENGKVYSCDTCDSYIGHVFRCSTCGMKTFCRRDNRCRYAVPNGTKHLHTHYWVKSGDVVSVTSDMLSLDRDDLLVPKVTDHMPTSPPWHRLTEIFSEDLYGIKIKLGLPPKSLFGYFDYPIGDDEKKCLLDTVREHKDEQWMNSYVNRYPECFCPNGSGVVSRTVFDKELHEHFYFDNGNYTRHYDSMPVKPVYKKVISIVRDFLDPPDKELILNFGYSSLTITDYQEVVGFDLIGLDDGNFVLTYRYKDSVGNGEETVRYHIKSGPSPSQVDVGTELIFRSDYRLSNPSQITVKKTGHVIRDMIYLDYDNKEYRFRDGTLSESKSSWQDEVGDKYPYEVYPPGIYTKVVLE